MICILSQCEFYFLGCLRCVYITFEHFDFGSLFHYSMQNFSNSAKSYGECTAVSRSCHRLDPPPPDIPFSSFLPFFFCFHSLSIYFPPICSFLLDWKFSSTNNLESCTLPLMATSFPILPAVSNPKAGCYHHCA